MFAIRSLIVALVMCLCTTARPGSTADKPEVSSPPESFFQRLRESDRQVARQFYTKYLDVDGMPVAAAAEVADEALLRTHEIVTHMLAGRPDVLQAMVDRGMYLVIIGKDQVYTDLPENRNARNPDYLNERVRGTGGMPTSFGEENLLSLPVDRYDDESIAVHEFCHTIDSTLRRIDPSWRASKEAAYRHAMEQGLYKDTYAATNAGEYWAEIAQSYFDCNRVNNWNHGPIGGREQLKLHDPVGYELVRSTFKLTAAQDWRYRWLQSLPNVGPPPAKLAVDTYYTKFTWAREFTVLGRQASDQSLLIVNDTIRKMFAYRHDILKALIAADVRLVVLGPDEHLSDLPELKEIADLDPAARFLQFAPETKLLVVSQENVLASRSDRYATPCQAIYALAKAAYQVTGMRPVDPNWENRGRDVQQYELRVQRMDVRFDEKLRKAYDHAKSRGQWKGSSAARDPAEYWAHGVLAYFDAVGAGTPPHDTAHPITNREALRAYDAGLFELVEQTMGYRGKVDWRRGR